MSSQIISEWGQLRRDLETRVSNAYDNYTCRNRGYFSRGSNRRGLWPVRSQAIRQNSNICLGPGDVFQNLLANFVLLRPLRPLQC